MNSKWHQTGRMNMAKAIFMRRMMGWLMPAGMRGRMIRRDGQGMAIPLIARVERGVMLVAMSLGLMLMPGCAKYEYQILRPAEVAGHIGASPTEVKLAPLVYKMQSYDNHLVVQVINPTDQPVEIIGAQSSIITPDMQSIPMAGQSIPPGAHVKLVLPPVRTDIQPTGPAIHIGFGMQGDAAGVQTQPVDADDVHKTLDDVASVRPNAARASRVVYLVDLDDSDYWDWDGQTDVSLILTCRQGEKLFTHELVIHRVKM